MPNPLDPLAMTPEEELLAIQEGSMLPPSEAPPYGDLPVGEFDPAVPVDPAPLPVPVPEVEPELSEEDRLRQRLGHKGSMDILLSGASGGKKYGLADQAKADLENHLKSKLTTIKGPKYVTADNKPIYVEGGTNFIMVDGKKIPYEGAMHIPKQKHDPNINKGNAPKLSPLDKDAQKAAAKAVVKWQTEDAVKSRTFINQMASNIARMEDSEVGLYQGEDVSTKQWGAGIISQIPWLGTLLAPHTKQISENVDKLSVMDLRTILGAQFTENEGKQMLKRTFSAEGDPAENIRRAKQILAYAKFRQQEKVRYAQHVRDRKAPLDFVSSEIPQDIVDLLDVLQENHPTGDRIRFDHEELQGDKKVSSSAPERVGTQDSEALQWAKDNPSDPRAAIILKGEY